jgi:hypothetical protein
MSPAAPSQSTRPRWPARRQLISCSWAWPFEHLVSFEKHCTNYRFRVEGRDLLATVVTVPELDGTFLELETGRACGHRGRLGGHPDSAAEAGHRQRRSHH